MLLSRSKVVFCAIFVALVLPSSINAIHRNSSSTPTICHSPQCLHSAADIKRNMDLSVHPCDDFYSYVCGRWGDSHPLSQEYIYYNWDDELADKINGLIRDQLKTNISRLDPKPVAQAKAMFRACLDSLQNAGRYRFKAAQKYLTDFGLPTVPTILLNGTTKNYTFDWISSVAKIQRDLAFEVLIGSSYEVDLRNRERFRLTLGSFSQTGELLMYVWSAMRPKGGATKAPNAKSQKSDNTKDGETNVDSYAKELANTLSRLIELVDYSVDITNVNSQILTLAEEFRVFNNQLPVVLQDDASKDEEPTYYSVAELQNITDSHIAPRMPYPIWQHFLDVLFVDLPDLKPEKLLIKPTQVKYLCNLVDFISKQAPELVELYIWKSVTEFLVDHPFNKLKSEEDCTETVKKLMSRAVIHTIADRSYFKTTKPRIEQMFNDVRAAFKQMVQATDWMDAKTKAAAIEKSNAMKALIGFPEWILQVDKLKEHYRALQVDQFRHFENWINARQHLARTNLQLLRVNIRTIWTLDPMIINAYSTTVLNVINIPMGEIQYPNYYLGLEALNYGSLGYVVGHELTHGFAEKGRHLDKSGKYGQWWSNHSLQEYEQRARCLVDQYNGYYVPEAKGYINGTLTLSENIADNGGLREAFRAYRAYVKRNGPEPLLPGFEKFTHKQLFFISFANVYCGTVYEYDEDVLSYTHSPPKYRVIGVLSNMEEFSKAFQCPRGSRMNPDHKCRVW